MSTLEFLPGRPPDATGILAVMGRLDEVIKEALAAIGSQQMAIGSNLKRQELRAKS